MSSPSPDRARRTALLLVASLALGAACEREERRFRETPPLSGASTPVTMNDQVQPGPMLVDPPTGDPRAYQADPATLAAGKRLYTDHHCADCHSPGGGGAMGPPLIDSLWLYGSEPENVFRTIVEGRPHGMPAFRDRIPEAELWTLVAYVRSLAGLAAAPAEPVVDSARTIAPRGAIATPRVPMAALVPPEQRPPGAPPPDTAAGTAPPDTLAPGRRP